MGSDDEAPEEYRELKFKTGSEEESEDESNGDEDSDIEGISGLALLFVALLGFLSY